jgi:hypothetical protein
MNSLVKVPPYSKLNFQGKNFFTQNWCNITLNEFLRKILFRKMYRVIIGYVIMTVFDIKGAKSGEISILLLFR